MEKAKEYGRTIKRLLNCIRKPPIKAMPKHNLIWLFVIIKEKEFLRIITRLLSGSRKLPIKEMLTHSLFWGTCMLTGKECGRIILLQKNGLAKHVAMVNKMDALDIKY